MKYSIITINYNNRDGLEKTIQSVINQTSKTFETYPELFIRIIEKGEEKISYTKKLSKVAGFDKETVVRRTNLKLIEDIRTSFINECF